MSDRLENFFDETVSLADMALDQTGRLLEFVGESTAAASFELRGEVGRLRYAQPTPLAWTSLRHGPKLMQILRAKPVDYLRVQHDMVTVVEALTADFAPRGRTMALVSYALEETLFG
jgi:hypothetical protein